MTARKYASAAAFRTALESRLNLMSIKEGQDIMRLRRQFVFDRFLCRVFHGGKDPIMLKGGYAMELRIRGARTTRDIDLCMKKGRGGPPSPEALLSFFQEKALLDLGDFVVFDVAPPDRELANAPYGGFRFPVRADMAGREFTGFSIDVAIGDVWLDDRDLLKGRDWLGFAGISAEDLPVVTIEQQLAEKLHSYTLPRQRPNSRVKDLVDIVLLLDHFKVDRKRMGEALALTFRLRKTHPAPDSLSRPPEEWERRFASLAQECGMNPDLASAHAKAESFWKTINLSD